MNSNLDASISNISKLNNVSSSLTLSSSTWSGTSAPYTYEIHNDNIYGANTNVIISIPYNITAAQRTAYKNAQIESAVIDTGSIIVYAYGTKPGIDIPVELTIGGGY